MGARKLLRLLAPTAPVRWRPSAVGALSGLGEQGAVRAAGEATGQWDTRCWEGRAAPEAPESLSRDVASRLSYLRVGGVRKCQGSC